MDPSKCLADILSATDVSEAIELCEALATWLRNGGFIPTVPPNTKYWPGTDTDFAILSPGYDTNYKWLFIRYHPSTGKRVESWVLPEKVLTADRWCCPKCGSGINTRHGNGIRVCGDCFHEYTVEGD